MFKSVRIVVLTFFLICLLAGCGGLSNAEKQEYYEKAVPIGQRYFQTYYDEEVIFTDYDINLPNSSTMFLYGYVKNDQAIKVSLSLDIPSMEVRSGKGPEDFIKKRKSEAEVNSQ